jgi:hypothetical protein
MFLHVLICKESKPEMFHFRKDIGGSQVFPRELLELTFAMLDAGGQFCGYCICCVGMSSGIRRYIGQVD